MKAFKKLWARVTGGPDPDDPKQVFAAAMADFRDKYRKSRDLVAGVLRQRDQVKSALDRKTAELEHVRQEAKKSVLAGDDAGAMRFLEREPSLERTVDDLQKRFSTLDREATRAREVLLELDAEVERLERDRERAAYLDQTADAHQSLRDLMRDLESGAASPALDRARSSLEQSALTQTIAHELDDQDRLASEPGRLTPEERLKALKQRL
ncbi:MAG: PspA/IM30 family protein [Candidatus Wallbacteria bacterium]|nr:PspA/IM30 family protein [Candidatus Wallbacteria bacterium]